MGKNNGAGRRGENDDPPWNPELEPRTRTPNPNSKEFQFPPSSGPMCVLLSLFVFSPQPLPSGEAMAPEPDFKGLGADHQKGYPVGFTLRLRWGLTAPSFPWLFASSRTKSVEAIVKRTEKINEKLSCHTVLTSLPRNFFRGKLRFLREFASAFAKERKGKERETGRGRDEVLEASCHLLLMMKERNLCKTCTGPDQDDVEGGKERWREVKRRKLAAIIV